VVSQACGLFVALVEEGWTDGPIAKAVAQRYLDPVFQGNAAPDCLVLGCTHFPAMRDTLQEVVGDEVLIVDSAKTTAEAVKEVLRKRNALRDDGEPGTIRFMATDSPQRFARVAANLVPEHMLPEEIELIDL